MAYALLSLPPVTVTEVTMKDPALLRQALKKFRHVSAEEGARMDAETPPCETVVNPRRMCVKIEVEELLKAQPKKG